MDINQLEEALKQLGVVPPNPERASLYLQYLTETQDYFARTLAGSAPDGLGKRYGFFKTALGSANLLNELSAILDYFIAPAVDKALHLAFAEKSTLTYSGYFEDRILNDNYDANVQDFYRCFPITAHAVRTLTSNFQQNIFLACRRIAGDISAIETLFADQYDFDPFGGLTGLKSIKSSGSDFHKGGQQVLILTFDMVYWGEKYPVSDELNLVYKPGDMEADCLLTGDSAAVNRVTPNFMAASLTEIINKEICGEKAAHPGSTLEELPTYRILPRNYMSRHNGGYPLPVRDAYGYIEYLDYHLSGRRFSLFNYYPFGSSDYVIFPRQDKESITKAFYRQMGQLLAIACTFSITDMHIENVRINRYRPFLIDLEVSLLTAINDITDTGLFLNLQGNSAGGIDGEHLKNTEYVWEVKQADDPGHAYLDRHYLDKYYQNRLWEQLPHLRQVLVDGDSLLEGFDNGMNILQKGQRSRIFDAWFIRLQNVLVRYLPFNTTFFRTIRDGIFIDTPMGDQYGSPVADIVKQYLLDRITTEYKSYQTGDPPNFLVLQQSTSGPDYQNLDIPAFYHRIGGTEIVDSQGRQVTIPADITTYADYPDTTQKAVNIGRAAFFADPPTTVTVQQGQVQALTDPAFFANRVQTMQEQVRNKLGRDVPPHDPGGLIAQQGGTE